MSFVIAAIFGDRLYMASDGLAKTNGVISQTRYKKIRRIGTNLIGYTGSMGICENVLNQNNPLLAPCNNPYDLASSLFSRMISVYEQCKVDRIALPSSMLVCGINNSCIGPRRSFAIYTLCSANNGIKAINVDSSACVVQLHSEYISDAKVEEIVQAEYPSATSIEDYLTKIIKRISKIDKTVNDQVFIEML